MKLSKKGKAHVGQLLADISGSLLLGQPISPENTAKVYNVLCDIYNSSTDSTVEIPTAVFKLILYILEEATVDDSTISNVTDCLESRAGELLSRGDVMSDLTIKSGVKQIKGLKGRLDAIRSLAQTCITESDLSDDTTDYIFTDTISELELAQTLQSVIG